MFIIPEIVEPYIIYIINKSILNIYLRIIDETEEECLDKEEKVT